VDLFDIFKRKGATPQPQDWITWGQSKLLLFPIGAGAVPQQSTQLLRARRRPPTTWTITTQFNFRTTTADLGAVQANLLWGVRYTLGLAQDQMVVSRSFRPGGGGTLSDAPVFILPQTGTLGLLDANEGHPTSFGPLLPTSANHTIVEQFAAEDLQVQGSVQWIPNAGSLGQAQCTITCFAAPVVY
jgi:hypothetical protein